MTYRLATYHGERTLFFVIGPDGPVSTYTERHPALAEIAARNGHAGNTPELDLKDLYPCDTPQRPTLSERLASTLRYIQSGASSGKASPKP